MKTVKTCSTCGGSGKIAIRKITIHNCPDCGGTGEKEEIQLKAVIIAGNLKQYHDYIQHHNLDRNEYRYCGDVLKAQGVDQNAEVILVGSYTDNAVYRSHMIHRFRNITLGDYGTEDVTMGCLHDMRREFEKRYKIIDPPVPNQLFLLSDEDLNRFFLDLQMRVQLTIRLILDGEKGIR